MKTTDVAIVGGGIVGLAFALAHARRGKKVTLFERTDFVIGASIRNFGLLWPVGQPAGIEHDRAMLSREIWLDVITKTKIWHAPTGSFHLAYAADELAVLEEYLTLLGKEKLGRAMLNRDQTLAKTHAVKGEDLLGALWSPTEINIDPREAIAKIPHMLKEQFGVELAFGVNVREVTLPKIQTTAGIWTAEEVVICSGADFQTLFPEAFQNSGLTLCKLQMMRSAPQPNAWQLGPTLCAGLTLTHYSAFKNCKSLKPVQKRFDTEMPFYVEHGIHVLLSQTAKAELTIGDSHHYGSTIPPFDFASIDAAILQYLTTFTQLPSYRIAEHWNGTYPKLPGRTEFIAHPAPGATVVTGLGGAGMTLSFGLAEQVVSGTYQGSEKVLT
jgi:D-hydroxyproline dehydrogenase subunit beta